MTESLDYRARTSPPPSATEGAARSAGRVAGSPVIHRTKPPSAVEVTALIREFGSPRSPIRAVDNLDLQVHTGEI